MELPLLLVVVRTARRISCTVALPGTCEVEPFKDLGGYRDCGRETPLSMNAFLAEEKSTQQSERRQPGSGPARQRVILAGSNPTVIDAIVRSNKILHHDPDASNALRICNLSRTAVRFPA